MFVFIIFAFVFFDGVELHRLKRFLNAEVHNRIDVLSTSQQEHTNWLKYMSIGMISTFVLILLLLIIVFILCRRFRPQPDNTTASSNGFSLSQTVDLPYLQHLHRIFSSTPASAPPPMSPPLNYPQLRF